MAAVHYRYRDPLLDPPSGKGRVVPWALAIGLTVSLFSGGIAYLWQARFEATSTLDNPDEPSHPLILVRPVATPPPPPPSTPVVKPTLAKSPILVVRTPSQPLDTPHPTSTLDNTPSSPNRSPATGLVQSGPDETPKSGGEGVGPVITAAEYDRTFDPETLRSYYPQRAADDEVEGMAQVECKVLETGRLASCVVVSEEPQGYGFGAATARAAEAVVKVKPQTVNGRPIAGATLRLPRVRWRLN